MSVNRNSRDQTRTQFMVPDMRPAGGHRTTGTPDHEVGTSIAERCSDFMTVWPSPTDVGTAGPRSTPRRAS